MIRRMSAAALLALAPLVVTGVTAITATAGAAAPAAVPSVASVAIVTSEAVDGRGLAQAVAESLERLRAGGMIGTIAVTDALAADAPVADLVVVVGDHLDQPLQDVATGAPQRSFVWVAAPDAPDFGEVSALPNVSTIVPAAHQAGWLLGRLAAAVSPDPATVSLVEPSTTGTGGLFAAGFAVGYGSAVDGAELTSVPAAAPGSVVVAGSSFDAAQAAAGGGAVALTAGTDGTQEGSIAASVSYTFDGLFYGVLAGHVAGTLPSGVHVASAANDGLALTIRPGAAIPPDAASAATAALEELRNGTREVVIDVSTHERVDAGESLASIADEAGVSTETLMATNSLSGEPAVGTVLVSGVPTRVATGASDWIDVNYVPTTAPPPPPPPPRSDDDDAPAGGGGGGSGDQPAAPADQPPPADQQSTPTPTPAPTAPPAPEPEAPSVGSCQGMGVGTANEWRAAVGVGGLGGGGLGSCDWARHLAETGTFQHAGTHAEVLYMGGSCGGAWSGWRGSPSHYDIIVSGRYTVGDFSCVVADGVAYAVGRLA
jgi:LysM repeat protein